MSSSREPFDWQGARRVAALATALGAVLALLCLMSALQPARTFAAPALREYQNPPGGCQAWTFDVIFVTAHPNHGATWPNALVTRNTPVQLVGTAERQQRDGNCQVTYTPLPFSWSATYLPNDGANASDATGSLANTSLLTPTLSAVNAGTYVVQLSATRAATVAIEVLDDGFRWINIGPDGRAERAVGRVNAIAFDPSQANTIYIGTANGGVWKTQDGGQNWRPLMDGKGLPTLGIGSVAVAPNGTVYAGLGDSNTFGDLDRARPGTGIYVSTDGGVTWNPTGTGGAGCGIVNLSGKYENAIRRIIVDPNNASTIYAAGDAGVFRSTNGGACWTSIRPSQTITEVIDDLALNALQLLAVSRTSGVYGTTNWTAPTPTWTRVLAPPCASTPLRAALARSATAGGQYVYAAFGCSNVQIRLSATYGGAGSWAPIPSLNENWQLDYNFALVVDPASQLTVYHGSRIPWRYVGPNGAWQNWNGPMATGGTPNANGMNAHSDVHVLAFDPFNPNLLFAGTDGGIYRFDVSGNPSVAASNWTALNGNLAISQFRTLGVNANWPEDVAGGLQDNATLRRLGGRGWTRVPGNEGDGYGALYDAINPLVYNVLSPLYSILYVNANAGQILGDLVRSNPFESSTPTIASPNEAWSDPYRPGVMIATSPGTNMAGNGGQLFYGTDANTTSNMVWTCIDPTPARADVVKSVGFARLFPSGSSGLYYVGLDSGYIYLVDVQASPPTFANCASGSALRAPAQPIFTPTTNTIGGIDGIAEDPNRPCRIYATSANPADQGYRVLRVEGVVTGNGCSGPWVAQPIAGLPNTADGLPNSLNGQAFGLHRWAVAVDPLTETLVYVGTYAGLYQGQNVSGNWHWSRVLDVPDILVVDIKAQVNAAGPFGTLFAATFGRGAYERVVTGGPAVAAAAAQRPQAANAITRCQVRESDDPDLHYRMADVEVDYAYNGDQGAHVKVRPNVVVNGVVSPYFVREVRDVVTGTHTANMQLIYAAADEPPGLTSNGLQVEMYPDGGSSFVVADCHFVKTWRRPDARVIEVRAVDLGDEGLPGLAQVPITISLSSGVSETHIAPFTFVVTGGAQISLCAPALRTDGGTLRTLHLWSLAGRAEHSSASSFSFVLQEDSLAEVRYLILSEKQYLPAIVK